jgi:hypothetical protein
MEVLAIKLEGKGRRYNASKLWYHFAICPSARTSAVFTIVSLLDTVTKSILWRRGYFLIFGTLTTRKTKQKIKNYRGIRELNLLISTNLSLSSQQVSQIVQGIVFYEIRRFECCSRMVLRPMSLHKIMELTHPCPAFCDDEGPGLEKQASMRRTTGHPVVVRTHSGTLVYTSHLV